MFLPVAIRRTAPSQAAWWNLFLFVCREYFLPVFTYQRLFGNKSEAAENRKSLCRFSCLFSLVDVGSVRCCWDWVCSEFVNVLLGELWFWFVSTWPQNSPHPNETCWSMDVFKEHLKCSEGSSYIRTTEPNHLDRPLVVCCSRGRKTPGWNAGWRVIIGSWVLLTIGWGGAWSGPWYHNSTAQTPRFPTTWWQQLCCGQCKFSWLVNDPFFSIEDGTKRS